VSHPCIDSAILYIEERLGMWGQEDKEALLSSFPELREVRQTVLKMAVIHADTTIVVLAIADVLGHCLLSCLQSSTPRDDWIQILSPAFAIARSNAWSLLRHKYGLDLSVTIKQHQSSSSSPRAAMLSPILNPPEANTSSASSSPVPSPGSSPAHKDRVLSSSPPLASSSSFPPALPAHSSAGPPAIPPPPKSVPAD